MLFTVLPLNVLGAGKEYANDFSNTESLNDITVQLNGGEVYTENGVLTVVGTVEYPPSTRVLFPFECTAEFLYEVDISFGGSDYDSAEFGLFFGFDGENEYKLAVRKNGSKTLFELSYWQKNESFTVLSSRELDCGTEFRLQLASADGELCVNAGDKTLLLCGAPYPTVGRVGVHARLVTARFDNVSIKNGKPNVKKISDSYNTAVYVPKTGIVSPPVVIERDNAKNGQYDVNMKRQAITVYDVKLTGGVLSVFSDDKILGKLEDRLKLSKGLTVPAFSVSDEQTAAALSAHLIQYGIKDAFVISAKEENINIVTAANPLVRGVIDASSSITVNPFDLYERAKKAGCNTVILPQRSVNANTVNALRSVFVTVYAVCGEKSTNSDIYTCLSSGCDGIIGDADAIISYMESFEDMTHFGIPLSVSFGGDELTAPLNSLSAVMSAAQNGSDAIQVDVCITDDGCAVLSAGDETAYLNQNVSIYATTISELKKLHYTDKRIPGETIATLSEVLKHLKNAYPDVVVYTRLSDDRAFTADAVNASAAEYGMESRVVILTEKRSVAKYANTSLKTGASCTGKVYTPLNADSNTAVCCIETETRNVNTAYFPQNTKLTREFLYYALSRGITVVKNDTREIKSLEVQKDGDGRVTVSAEKKDGTVYDVTDKAEFVTVSGTPIFHEGCVSGQGVFAMRVPFADGYVYTRSISAQKIEQSEETTAEPDEKENDTNIMKYIIIAGCAVMVAGGLIFFGVLKRSSFKAKNE